MAYVLPNDYNSWIKLVRTSKLQNDSLFTLLKVNSGSEFTLPQFLMLRVFYKPMKEYNSLESLFNNTKDRAVTADIWTNTGTFLEQFTDFQEYLKAIEEGRDAKGSFAMTRLYQRRCAELKDEFCPDVDRQKVELPDRRVTRGYARALKQTDTSPSLKPAKASAFGTKIDGLSSQFEGLSVNETDPKTPKSSSDPSGDGNPKSDPAGVGKKYMLTPLPKGGDPMPAVIEDQAYKFIEDEQIVNFALLLLVDALVIECKDATGDWSPYRAPFEACDRLGEKVYQACVDGLYRQKKKKDSEGADPKKEELEADMIIEVKPHSRREPPTADTMAVNMQESAQMAAWISKVNIPGQEDGKHTVYRRVLISQNRRQIFVTIAKYDQAYVDYIKGNTVLGEEHEGPDGPFLTMERHGPYDITNWEEMRWISHMLLALSIQGRILDLE